MISREPAGLSTAKGGIFGQWDAEIPLVGALFAPRYGKICDSSHLISIIHWETAR